jgi:hypothetical protein
LATSIAAGTGNLQTTYKFKIVTFEFHDSHILGLVDVGVSLHGAAHTVAQVNNSKCPLRFITVANDPHFSAEAQEQLRYILMINYYVIVTF